MKLTGDNTVRYLTKTGEQIAGPYTPEGLESLVYLGKITPETLLSPEGQELFTPIKESPLCRVLFPRLKEKAKPKDWGRPGESDSNAQHHRQEFEFAEAKFEKVNADPGTHHPIEVTALLEDIRNTEIISGADLVDTTTRFRISKRSRDFWFMLVVGNTLLIGGGILMQNTTSIVFGIGGAGLYTFGLLWSMYGVMDRY